MKLVLFAMVLATLPFLQGCGSSPYDEGKVFAKSVISSLESGNPSAFQKAAEDAQAKSKNMSPADAVKFLQGYNEVAMPYMRSKMPK